MDIVDAAIQRRSGFADVLALDVGRVSWGDEFLGAAFGIRLLCLQSRKNAEAVLGNFRETHKKPEFSVRQTGI